MFLFLRKYGVEMSRAELPVSSYTRADLAAPNWRHRIGGAELSHSVYKYIIYNSVDVNINIIWIIDSCIMHL